MALDAPPDRTPLPPTPPPPGAPTPAPATTAGLTSGQWARAGLLVGLLILLTAKAGPWGLVIVLGLVFIIFMHELGHFLAARRSGMKVTEFFLGFGPRIWSVSRNGIEYGIKAIPAGAYVKIVGMHNLEDVAEGDEPVTYRQQPFWQRFSVAVAGSAMHFAMALVLLFVLVTAIGVPDGRIDPNKQDPTRWVIDSVVPGSAAQRAGLRVGDKIVAIGDQRVADFDDLRVQLASWAGRRVDLDVRRDGRTLHLPATPTVRVVDGQRGGFLGIGQVIPSRRVNPVRAVPEVASGFTSIAWQSIAGLGRLFSPAGLAQYGRTVVNAKTDRKASAQEQAQIERLNQGGSGSSPVTTTSGSGENRLTSLLGVFTLGVQLGSTEGAAAVVAFFAMINIFIGLFNLIPLLPFDGGHIAIAVYEKVQELRQRRGRRYFADVGRLMPLTYLVVVVLAGIFVTSVYVDIVNPISLK